MCAHVYLQAEAQTNGMSSLSTAAREFLPAVQQQQQQQAALSTDQPKEPLPSKEVTTMCPLHQIQCRRCQYLLVWVLLLV